MTTIDAAAWPSQFRPVLSKLVAHGAQYFGWEPTAVEPVGQVDRPYSTILQIRVARAAASADAFVKILKPREETPEQIASMRQNVLKDFEMTRQVHYGLSGHPGLMAVRPIACFPEDLAIVTERASGTTLADLLARGSAGWAGAAAAERVVNVMRLVGAWLRAAQSALPQDRYISADSMRVYFGKRLDRLECTGHVRLTAHGRSSIERSVDRLLAAAGGGDLPAVWIHADFCPENIIALDGEEGITVLDFTMAKTGTVYHDLAHLFLRIDSMRAKPWFRRVVIARLQRELLHSFEPGLEPGRPLFALMLLQHVICHVTDLQASTPGRLTRFHIDRLHRRHRTWLGKTAGLDERSWTR